jgi:Bifunctional DNA primase/polymerase, N-terminal
LASDNRKDSAPSVAERKAQISTDADQWYAAGVNVLPMKANGKKEPAAPWKKWQTERIPESQHHKWFEEPKYHGLAIICGAKFGEHPPVELFETETPVAAQSYIAAAEAAGLRELLARVGAGYQEKSGGGGLHLLWRCEEVGPSTVLAAEADGTVLIETRGVGGLAIVAPTLGTVHEDENSPGWERTKGAIATVAEITPEERAALHALAQTLDRRPPPEPYRPKGGQATTDRNLPGADYTASDSPTLAELLEEDGWSLYRKETIEDREVEHWARPGKVGTSATLGYARDAFGGPALYVFSTSTAFEANRAYDKFGVYAVLKHGGDFKAAAKELRSKGYGKQGGGGGSGEKKADLLLAIIEEDYDLGQTPGGDFYGVAKEGQGSYVARMIGKKSGGQLRAELASKYAARYGEVPDDQTIRNTMLVVKGQCMNAEPVELGLRAARFGDASILDMGDRSGRAIVLTPDGWEIVDRSPVLFRRTKLTQALPEPVRGGRLIRPLRNFIHLADNSMFPVLVACLVFIVVRPDEPAPVPYFTGEAGAVKTGATRAYARMVDPTYPQTRRRPTNEKDWVIAARGSRVVALDNLYGIQDWLQGSMCRAVTGEGDVSRELYSDDDLVVMSYRRALTFNGIDVSNLRDDLADRVIRFEIPMMNPRKRLKDRVAADAFEEAWPEMLGGVLDLACKTLKELPKVEMPADGWSRMADFEEVQIAVDRVLHTKGFEAYRRSRERLAEDVIEDRTFTALLRAYVDRRDPVTKQPVGAWETTCQDMLDALTNNLHDSTKPPKGWPETARAVSGILKSAAPSFRKLGYEVEYLGQVGKNRERTWRIAKSSDPYKIAGGEPEPEDKPF